VTTSEQPTEPGAERRTSPLVVEDLRMLRRWLAVMTAIAIVAVGVAVYAVIKAGDSAEEDRVTELEQALRDRLQAVDRELQTAEEESDVERLESRVRGTAEERDITRVDRRVRRMERDVVDALDAAADTGRGLARLERRVDRLARRRR
jgi:GTPase